MPCNLLMEVFLSSTLAAPKGPSKPAAAAASDMNLEISDAFTL